ncbi:MAG: HAD hydrolase-like protein [Clostridia bacterium]|nr:HAD hydrolase-like protein [Clostridia bacterium]
MKLKSFLNKYDTIIFDMDGVITSEQNYWNAAALTVWETLADKSHAKIDTEYCMRHLKEIRGEVFCGDELISVLKSKGVNSNWDLGYVTVLIAWITKGDEQYGSFRDVLTYAKQLPDNIIEAYDALAQKCCDVTGYDMYYLKRNGELWQEMHELFQEWFLGDELRGKMSAHGHKAGLLYKEEPIVDKEGLLTVLKLLSETKRVCTGTGRPRIEMLVPLSDWKALPYFAADGLCNYDHVANAEQTLNNNALTKPHPYMFLKALYGTDYDDKKLIDGDYDKEKIKTTLIVGDAGADILAARAMGADFCAVLTGIQGVGARAYFEKMNAEYILNSVVDFLED